MMIRASWGAWVLGAAAALMAGVQARGQCDPQWLTPQQTIGTRFGTVAAITSWDPDGPGPEQPRPVIAGDYSQLGGAIADVAMWDGGRWNAFGDGTSAVVHTMTAWDADGPGPGRPLLVAGGDFIYTHEGRLDRIAAWDGVSWRAIGERVSGPVRAVLTRTPDAAPDSAQVVELVAGGDFVVIDEAIVNRIARWNGVEWAAMGAGFNSRVRALTNWDPDGAGGADLSVVAGGEFTTSGGVSVRRVARWTGSVWEPLTVGTTGRVNALCAWDPDGPGPAAELLVVAGEFTAAGGAPANRIAIWDGAAWSPLGSGVNAAVHAVGVWDVDGDGPGPARLVAAGDFTTAGGATANRMAMWDGVEWRSISTGASSTVRAVTAMPTGPSAQPELVAAGDFVTMGDLTVNRVARHDGNGWRPFGGGFNAAVAEMMLWDRDGDGPARPEVIAGGDFVTAGGVACGHIARWDGLTWHPLGTGTDGTVLALTAWDPDGPGGEPGRLIAGGGFAKAGGAPALNIAQWDGVSWSPMAAGLSGSVESLTTWDSDGDGPAERVVVACGNFSTTPGGTVLNRIAWWDGEEWQPLGEGFNSRAAAVVTWDPDGAGPLGDELIATGNFRYTGDTPVDFIARWDGARWRPMGGFALGGANTFAVWDPDGEGPRPQELLAAGSMTLRGTSGPVRNVVRWDGAEWVQAVADTGSIVLSLLRWNPDGQGPDELIAGGRFSERGYILHWDGSQWREMQNGVNQFVRALVEWRPSAEAPPELLAGGDFYQLDGEGCGHWAKWTLTGAPTVAIHPESVDVIEEDTAVLIAAPSTGYDVDGPVVFQWMRDGVAIQNGPGGASSGGGVVSGATGSLASGEVSVLTVDGVRPSDSGAYTVVLSNGCGEATSEPGLLGVEERCPADLNGDGFVDFSDYLEFLNLYDAQDPRADFNRDGFVDFTDYLEFLNLYDAGC